MIDVCQVCLNQQLLNSAFFQCEKKENQRFSLDRQKDSRNRQIIKWKGEWIKVFFYMCFPEMYFIPVKTNILVNIMLKLSRLYRLILKLRFKNPQNNLILKITLYILLLSIFLNKSKTFWLFSLVFWILCGSQTVALTPRMFRGMTPLTARADTMRIFLTRCRSVWRPSSFGNT